MTDAEAAQILYYLGGCVDAYALDAHQSGMDKQMAIGLAVGAVVAAAFRRPEWGQALGKAAQADNPSFDEVIDEILQNIPIEVTQ